MEREGEQDEMTQDSMTQDTVGLLVEEMHTVPK